MKGSHAIGAGILISALLTVGGLAFSSEKGHKHVAIPETGITLEQAIATAKGVVPGRVIEAELEQEDDKVLYEVEMVDPKGTVHEVTVDASSGKVVKNEIEDEHDNHEDHDSGEKD